MIKTFSLIETSVNQTNFLLIHIEIQLEKIISIVRLKFCWKFFVQCLWPKQHHQWLGFASTADEIYSLVFVMLVL